MSSSHRPWGALAGLVIAVLLAAISPLPPCRAITACSAAPRSRRRAPILQRQLDTLESEVARMENLTRRLSDEYLDLDLLDEQARDVLGLIRADELVIR